MPVGTLILAEIVFVASVTDVAVSVTFSKLAGADAGAVYVVATPLAVEVGETDPHAWPEHDSVQVTPLFAESLTTVAVNCAAAPAFTVAVVGERETLMGGGGVAVPPHPQFVHATSKRSSVPTTDPRFFDFMTYLDCLPTLQPNHLWLLPHIARTEAKWGNAPKSPRPLGISVLVEITAWLWYAPTH
jgi:hypothetical protein